MGGASRGTVLKSGQRRRAFEAEVLPHLDAAYRLAYALVGSRPDAEDLVQEACLRAFAAFDRFTSGTNARAWLLTILRRVHLNNRRHLQTHPTALHFGGPGDDEDVRDIADTQTPGPEEETLRALDRALVLELLAELPEDYRTVLALVDLNGLRYAEAAEVIGCPTGTVMSRLHRARWQLGARLQRAGAFQIDTAPALDAPAQPAWPPQRARVLAEGREGVAG